MLRKTLKVLALTVIVAAIPSMAIAATAGPAGDCCCPLCCPGK